MENSGKSPNFQPSRRRARSPFGGRSMPRREAKIPANFARFCVTTGRSAGPAWLSGFGKSTLRGQWLSGESGGRPTARRIRSEGEFVRPENAKSQFALPWRGGELAWPSGQGNVCSALRRRLDRMDRRRVSAQCGELSPQPLNRLGGQPLMLPQRVPLAGAFN